MKQRGIVKLTMVAVAAGALFSCASAPLPGTSLAPQSDPGARASTVVMVDAIWVDSAPIIDESVPEPAPAPATVAAVSEPISTYYGNAFDAEPSPPPHSCGEQYVFEPGLLRQSISEAISRCGYSMGEWQLGNKEFFVDFPIRSSFTVAITDGVEDVIEAVRSSYGVRGTINPTTKVIDFSRDIAGAN